MISIRKNQDDDFIDVFNVDFKTKQLNAFIYLTDCLLLNDGPYTYVKGSHLDGPLRRLNQSISQVMPNRTKTLKT